MTSKSDDCLGKPNPTKCCTDLYKDSNSPQSTKDNWIKKCVIKSEKSKPKPPKPKPTTKKAKKKAEVKAVEVKAEKDREVRTKKTQCNLDWMKKKIEKKDALAILRTCGTKRLREFAKCHDPAYAEALSKNPDYAKVFKLEAFKPLFDGSQEGCIQANEKRITMKRGTKSDGFLCANEFKKSCFKEIRETIADNKGKKESAKKKIPTNKRKHCATAWEKRKFKEFINTKTDPRTLLVSHVDKCLISHKPKKVK